MFKNLKNLNVVLFYFQRFFSTLLLSRRIRHNKSLAWGGYRILVKGVWDMDHQKWNPVCGGRRRESKGKN